MSLTFPTLSPKEFMTLFLRTLSSLRKEKLSPQELDMLVAFSLLPHKFTSFPFSTVGKKKVAKQLKISNQALHARIYSLLKKGYLRKDEDGVVLLPAFIHQTLTSFLKGSYALNISFTLDNSKDYSSLTRDFPAD
jgi:hypothetical protein